MDRGEEVKMKVSKKKTSKPDQLFRSAQTLYGAKAFPLLLKAAKLGHDGYKSNLTQIR